jgi:ferritin
MISKVVSDAINDQIKNEIYSGYLYLSMSTYCESVNLPGFAHWLRAQSKEEIGHAMKLRSFVEDRDGRVILQAIDQPPADFRSPLDLFKNVLEHEKKVSATIHRLYELALKENDYPTQIFLQWFIQEQVEEEKNATQIVEQLKLTGEQPNGLMMIDRMLAARAAG